MENKYRTMMHTRAHFINEIYFIIITKIMQCKPIKYKSTVSYINYYKQKI